ncbi:MAG: hypothetical protein KZQ85_09255 [Candidatus Thiodiazotropha sp. (ex Myrtea sp. 'scaly one' KF741663)]|nr:hypothetical protein [Candidatus Thiodiazotropha sp. (ex Myrtea sp. 'scaly one' KF741663)]
MNDNMRSDHKKKRRRIWPWILFAVLFIPLTILIWKNWTLVNYQLRDYPFFGREFEMIDPSKEIMHIKIGEYVADIPSNYFYRKYVMRGVWWRAPSELLGGDVINLEVTWPELMPWSTETDKVFREPGRAQIISVSIRKIRNEEWPFHYFKNYRQYLELMPDSNEAPSLLHFIDTSTERSKDVFLEYDEPRYGMKKYVCSSRNGGVLYPSCKLRNSVYKENYVISYSFSRKHLSQWREIDLRLKQMFDSFLVAESN